MTETSLRIHLWLFIIVPIFISCEIEESVIQNDPVNLYTQINELQERLLVLQNKVSNLESDNKTLTETNRGLQSELQSIQRDLTIANTKITSLESINKTLNSQIEKVNEMFSKLQNQLSSPTISINPISNGVSVETSTLNPEFVISIFSDIYEEESIVIDGTYIDEISQSDQVIKLESSNSMSIDLGKMDTGLDISEMTHLHLNYWITKVTSLKTTLVSSSPDNGAQDEAVKEASYVLTLGQLNEWVKLEIPLNEFTGVDFSHVTQIKLEKDGEGSPLAVYFDEIYLFNGDSTSEESDEGIDLDDPLYEASDFVWKAMNFWYFWQEDVDLLADSQATDQKKYKKLIEENSNPRAFFESLLYNYKQKGGDEFSWFIENYVDQEKSFAGVSKDHGMQFGLVREDREKLLGYVQVVHAGSSAEERGVERGMLFSHVNDIRLTVSNYEDLLDFDDTFTINLAEPRFFGNSFVGIRLTDKRITLTRVEDFRRDPIVHKDVLEIGGKKIGYLFYNQFVDGERILELNDVFAEFKTAGIDDLVVDLRYNRGGFSFTANFMATAISGRNGDEVVGRTYWNQKVLAAFFNGEPEVEKFPQGTSSKEGEGEPINKLNLNRVFFIVSSSSASASEGLINNLKPYMEVIVVGEKTRGKNSGSITLYDKTDREPISYYIRGDGTVNPNHTYALQPLVFKSGNADGFLDFEDGLVPTITLRESILRLGKIGDLEELLLNRVLQEIVPSARRSYTPPEDIVTFEPFERPEDKVGIWHYEFDEKFLRKLEN